MISEVDKLKWITGYSDMNQNICEVFSINFSIESLDYTWHENVQIFQLGIKSMYSLAYKAYII